MNVNAWGDLAPRLDVLVAKLRPIGQQIGQAAREGDPVAQRVVSSYTFLHQCVDPMALHLTEEALAKWQAQQAHIACTSEAKDG